MRVKVPPREYSVGDYAESPRELTRTPEVCLNGLCHWIDPDDADRTAAVKRAGALMPVLKRAFLAQESLEREQHRAREGVVLQLRELAAEAAKRRRHELSEVYASGLALRKGRRINMVPPGDPGWDLFMFEWFHGFGVDEPPGIAWCRTCAVVFSPSRKSHAHKCDRCHHHPPPAPLAPEPTADGSCVYATPSEKGWNLVRLTRCKECRVLFIATRSDARRCPNRKVCREQAATRRENIERGFFQPY